MPDKPDPVESLFALAIELRPDERGAFLDRECGGDAALRERLAALLRAHDQTGHLLDRPLPDDLEATVAHFAAEERVGVVIAGRYKLLEEIGEGGMGSVWVAEQTVPVQRKVAIKLIKAGMDSRQVLARFEAERQALAMMDHANIAKVLDGGLTEKGRPFFAMEYVKGVAITEFCDTAQLSIADRLQLFVQVCSAVQHAHQKGIIHRDLKPSNILVAPYDGRPVPKVIDFGLAKAMYQPLTERTLHTAHGMLLGTPLYISPEQAQLNNLDVDTRTDIYSLGVLLYELLTGTTPLERKRFQEAAWDEIRRIIREEEPPSPSTRLSSSGTLPSLAACRHTEPARLTKEIRGDLDWIALKALEKDRTRRYETANAFAADVQRYLASEPVAAHPPSTAYRFRKFVVKHRGPVLAASLVLATMVIGIVGTTWGLVRAEQQRQRAVEFRDMTLDALRASTGTDVEKLLAGKQTLGTNERTYLEAIGKRWQNLAAVEGNDEHAFALRGEAHFRVGTLWHRLGRREEARREYESALQFQEKLANDFPASGAYRRELATTQNNLGVMLTELGKQTEAAKMYRQAILVQKKLTEDFPDVPDYHNELGRSHNNLGRLLTGEDAKKQFDLAIAIQEKLSTEFPTQEEFRAELAGAHNNRGMFSRDIGEWETAKLHFGRAIEVYEQLVADFPNEPRHRWQLAGTHLNLGNLLIVTGEQPKAADRLRKSVEIQASVASEFPSVPDYSGHLAISHNSLAAVLWELGDSTGALENFGQALKIQERLVANFRLPVYRADLARSHNNIGRVLGELNERPKAHQHYSDALTIQKLLVEEFPSEPAYRFELARTHNGFGRSLGDAGDWIAALQQLLAALTIQTKLTADSPKIPDYRIELAATHLNLGNIMLRGSNDQRGAKEHYDTAIKSLEDLVADYPSIPDYRAQLAQAQNNLAFLLATQGKLPESEAQFRKAIAIQEKLVKDLPNVTDYQIRLAMSQRNLGILLTNGNSPDDALPWLEKSIALLKPIYERNPRLLPAKMELRNASVNRAQAYERLERCSDALQDFDRAIELSPEPEKLDLRSMRVLSLCKDGQIDVALAEVEAMLESANGNPSRLYNYTCAYSVASNKVVDKKQVYGDRAIELLKMAVKAGFTDANHMSLDHDLDPLRDRKEFKDLIEQLKVKK